MTEPTPRPANVTGPRIRQVSVAALPVIILLAVAWFLYRPDVVRPFDYVDFPEYILILDAHQGFVDQFTSISLPYAEHGRWIPIMFASIVAQWSWFERWMPGWQIFRFVIMSGVVVMAYALFRRLRLTAIGAFTAASLLVLSPSAVMGWTRLSTAEPLGMVFLLVACHLALKRQTLATASAFALMLLGTLWTKEIVTAAFLFPVILATQAHRVATDESNSAIGRSFSWFVPSLVVLVLGAIPIVHMWASAPSDSFVSRYGSASFKFIDIVGATMAAWLPFAPIQTDPPSALLVAVVAFLLITVVGWSEALRHDSPQRLHRLILTAGALVPMAGALIYAPWPFYLLIYALPFIPAGSLVFGQATTSLLRSSTASRLTAAVGLAMVLTFCLAQTANESGRMYALQRSFASSVTHVSHLSGIDTVLVGVESAQYDSRGNFGPRFRGYATMLGLDWPPVRDVPCDQLPLIPTKGALVIRLNLMCVLTSSPQSTVVNRYNRFLWPNPLPRRDSVVVTFTSPTTPDSLP